MPIVTVVKVVAHSQVLDRHLLMPESAQFIQILALGVLDVPSNGIVCATHPALDLEFDICFESSLRALDRCVISKLVLHFAEKDSSGVHVGLCDEAARALVVIPSHRVVGHDLLSLVPIRESHHSDTFHETSD